MVSCGVRDKIKEKHLSLSTMDETPENEIDYDQTAMGLSPITSAVFLIAK
jgi:hypothetical protein